MKYFKCGHPKSKQNTYIRPDNGFLKCKICRRNRVRKFYKTHPWCLHYKTAKARCEDIKGSHYHRYGGRGIEMLMTKDDFKFLWFRDKAYNLKRPSVDRIDNDGHYSTKNCQYMEFDKNSNKDRDHKGKKNPFYGKHHTKESKIKLQEYQKRLGKLKQ